MLPFRQTFLVILAQFC